jgi:uncharacterized damage-inducible protein DinB
LILEQLDHEAEITRRVLASVPEGQNDWKPHPKSMELGVLAHLVAMMPSWIALAVTRDELDVRPKEPASAPAPRKIDSRKGLLEAHEKAVEEARAAIGGMAEEKLQTPWKLLEGGKVVLERTRYETIRDNFTHSAHHRGQLSVYLRLKDVPVPFIYGPSADDHRF